MDLDFSSSFFFETGGGPRVCRVRSGQVRYLGYVQYSAEQWVCKVGG